MRRHRYVTAALLLLSVAAAALLLARPQAISLMPIAAIRRRLFLATPIRSSMPTVQHYVAKTFGVQTTWIAERETVFIGDYPAPGSGSAFISAHLGYYCAPLRTDAEAFWIFDRNHQLKEIHVRKTVDGP